MVKRKEEKKKKIVVMGNFVSSKLEDVSTECLVAAVKGLGEDFSCCAEMMECCNMDGGNTLS